MALLVACQKIETGQTIDARTMQLVKSLGLLGKDEHILLYYSNFEKSKAGSFLTDKRIAHYWLEKNSENNRVESACYPDIISITPQYKVPDFDCPYIEITAKNGARFRAYMDGSSEEKKLFFEQAVGLWHKSRMTNVAP